MKKVLASVSLAALAVVFLSSCGGDPCYDCTIDGFDDCTIEICDETVSTSGECGGASVSASGLSNEEIKDLYVSVGYDCTEQE